jgi:hypothetical protein
MIPRWVSGRRLTSPCLLVRAGRAARVNSVGSVHAGFRLRFVGNCETWRDSALLPLIDSDSPTSLRSVIVRETSQRPGAAYARRRARPLRRDECHRESPRRHQGAPEGGSAACGHPGGLAGHPRSPPAAPRAHDQLGECEPVLSRKTVLPSGKSRRLRWLRLLTKVRAALRLRARPRGGGLRSPLASRAQTCGHWS